MNIVNKGLLKLVLLPKKLYSSSGINTSQLENLLVAKLVMDDRRPASVMQNRRRNKEKKEVSKATITTMIVSAFMGCIFLFSFALNTTVTAQLTFYLPILFSCFHQHLLQILLLCLLMCATIILFFPSLLTTEPC